MLHTYEVKKNYKHIVLHCEGIHYAETLCDLVGFLPINNQYYCGYPDDLEVGESFNFGDFTVTRKEDD